MKKNYKFDLRSGHYIILNEAEDNTAQQNDNNQQEETINISPLPSLNTEEVVA